MPSQNQLRETITNQIIDALQNGGLPPWRQPWSNDLAAGPACNVVSHNKYRGINPLLLACASMRHNLTSKFWGTFKQWKELGGRVMRRPSDVPPGQWGTGIIFWSKVTKTEENEHGEEEEKEIFFMRTYTVFNIDQVEGSHLNHLRVGHSVSNANPVTYEEADRVIEATDADIRFGGNRACYCRSGDFIQVPMREQFTAGEWYETIFHELCHWTQAPNRLNWNPVEGGYALGERMAEIGSCYLAGEIGIPMAETSVNHQSYIASWLRGLENDHRFIFQASSQASKAADLIPSFSREPVEEQESALV